MTEIERLHLENDAVILRASNYLLRDQLAPRLSEDPVALQNAIGIRFPRRRHGVPRGSACET
jgi:hypothetical protein